VAKQIDRGKRRQDAHNGRQTDKPQIMGRSNAIIDLQHMMIPQSGKTAICGGH
jgi:hypothetical protein